MSLFRLIAISGVALGLALQCILGADANTRELGPQRAPLSNARLFSLYTLHCAGCHLADGSSMPSNGIPDLRLSGRYGQSDLGRQYLIQVPGVSQSHLDDATTAELLNWTLQRFSSRCLAANFRPFTSEEVARLRRSPLSDTRAWTRALANDRRSAPATCREAGRRP